MHIDNTEYMYYTEFISLHSLSHNAVGLLFVVAGSSSLVCSIWSNPADL